MLLFLYPHLFSVCVFTLQWLKPCIEDGIHGRCRTNCYYSIDFLCYLVACAFSLSVAPIFSFYPSMKHEQTFAMMKINNRNFAIATIWDHKWMWKNQRKPHSFQLWWMDFHGCVHVCLYLTCYSFAFVGSNPKNWPKKTANGKIILIRRYACVLQCGYFWGW